MPFVTVEIVGDLDRAPDGLAQALADACSPAFPPEHREVWVRIHRLSRDDWAITAPSKSGALPVFVCVVREDNPIGNNLKHEVAELSKAVSKVTGRAIESICVTYEPSARGRLAFGGKLIR